MAKDNENQKKNNNKNNDEVTSKTGDAESEDIDVSLSLSLSVGGQNQPNSGKSNSTAQEYEQGGLTSPTTPLPPPQTVIHSMPTTNTPPTATTCNRRYLNPSGVPTSFSWLPGHYGPYRNRGSPSPVEAASSSAAAPAPAPASAPTSRQRQRSETIPVIYPWGTDRRARIRSHEYLIVNNIKTITGKVLCKKCERHFDVEYDLETKFREVYRFIAENRRGMHDRAPSVWMTPVVPTCQFCRQENSAKPVISNRNREINWLFLLLGQMLGCLTLDQLKYFCKHTQNHRTGAKDRVLYLTYLELCKQLDPAGPFDRS